MTLQIVKPLSYISSSGWAAVGSVDGIASINEDFASPDDNSSYIYAPASGGGVIYRMNLQTPQKGMPTDAASTHQIRVRMRRVLQSGTGLPANPSVVAALIQSGVTILGTNTWNMGSGFNSYTSRTWTLSDAIVASITDYDNLDLWFQYASGSKYEVRITVCDMRMPDPNPRHLMMGHFA